MLKKLAHALLAALFSTPLAAADLALVIGNEDYRNIADNRRGDEVVGAAAALADAGVEVISVRNGDLEETRGALRRFVQSAPAADRLLIVMSSRFVSTATDTYMLAVDSEMPSLADVAADSLPVSVALTVLGEAPGRSVLVMATEAGDVDDLDGYLRTGYGTLDAPQGVTLITAEPRPAAEFIEDVLAVPGRGLARGIEVIDGAEVSGFVPTDYAFLPPGRQVRQDEDGDSGAWQVALDRDTVAGYRDYLDAHPQGANSAEARRRIENLRNDPAARAEAAEEALALDREERQQIQRDLVLLGYDTRGIDGIFGPGTRGALRSWQEDEGLDVTGYLNADHEDRLARAAVARNEELEREAAERRAERLRADRAFWTETGETETEAGYRRYLEEYPDGIHAEIAQARLAAIEERRRAEADAADRAAWEEARRADTVDAYRRYLERHPEGAFAREARAVVEGGAATERAEQEAARNAERALGLNPLTARLVEERLAALGLKPGPVDGSIDERSRRAIRRYQDDRNLPVTGYLNQPTVVQLLADSVRQILD